jgi:hypothetical protein
MAFDAPAGVCLPHGQVHGLVLPYYLPEYFADFLDDNGFFGRDCRSEWNDDTCCAQEVNQRSVYKNINLLSDFSLL